MGNPEVNTDPESARKIKERLIELNKKSGNSEDEKILGREYLKNIQSYFEFYNKLSPDHPSFPVLPDSKDYYAYKNQSPMTWDEKHQKLFISVMKWQSLHGLNDNMGNLCDTYGQDETGPETLFQKCYVESEQDKGNKDYCEFLRDRHSEL